jgi:exoribonuclease II
MNVFYEEDGGFKVGHLMSEAAASAQIESASGKRSKVKSNAILLRFDSPSVVDFMPAAMALTTEHDVPFLWEVCGADDFSAEALAADYIGRKPTAVEIAAVALTLHQSPMYFYKRGKGVYKRHWPAWSAKSAKLHSLMRGLRSYQAVKCQLKCVAK